MSRLILNRRRLIGLGAASAGSLVLAGCDQFDFLGQRNDPVRDFLERANSLTYAAQRALVGQQALAKEFSESEIRQGQRPNGSTDPRQNIEEYRVLEANGFAGYRLKITGLVETPKEYTLAELQNMPTRTQITRHMAIDVEATWTPDGQSLIFTSDRSGKPQLYQVSASGGEPTRITFQGQYNARPSVCCDGKQIAMVQGSGNVYRIAVVDRGTGQYTQISPGNQDESPSFAPNGSMVLYASSEGSRGVLYSASADGRDKWRQTAPVRRALGAANLAESRGRKAWIGDRYLVPWWRAWASWRRRRPGHRVQRRRATYRTGARR